MCVRCLVQKFGDGVFVARISSFDAVASCVVQGVCVMQLLSDFRTNEVVVCDILFCMCDKDLSRSKQLLSKLFNMVAQR